MMRLSTIWNVDRTIDSSGSSPVASVIVESWQHDPGSVRFFRSSANFLYSFSLLGKRHFVRFADSSEGSRAAVVSEMTLLRWLASAGIAVPLPVPSLRGNDMETVTTPWGTFHAVVFPAVEGTQRDVGDLDQQQFCSWGAALGRLQAALTACPGEIAGARPRWRDRLREAQLVLPSDASTVHEEYEQIVVELDSLTVNSATFGVVHFDFELDNLVWGENNISVLDFHDCGRCWFAADIAFALRDLFDNGANIDDPAVHSFIEGYASHQTVDEDLIIRLPLFSRMSRLLNYASVARALDLAEDPAHPRWLNALVVKLRGRMRDYESLLA